MNIRVTRIYACPNCNSQKNTHWCFGFDLLLHTSEQRYEYLRCRNCRCVFLSTLPSSDEFNKLYPSEYHPYLKLDDRAPKGWVRLDRLQRSLSSKLGKAGFQRRVESYYGMVQPGSTFLDFGCGAGRQLDKMRVSGIKTIGMDFSERALMEVRRSGHSAVPVSREGWDCIPNETIDMVRANHVIEHLTRIDEPLAALYERLRHGGLMHIAVPNPEGLSAVLFRGRWHGLDCPRHLVLYPASTLAGILESIGFRVREVLFEPLTKDHIRSWAYLLQKFDLLKSRSVDDFIERPELRLLAGVPMTLAMWLGRGDRFHIFASKP